MEIFFSVDNNGEVLKLPYVAPGTVFNTPLNTSTFETTEGTTLTLVGEVGLRSFAVESFFPSRLYSWLPNITLSDVCVAFFKKNRKKKFRVVVVSLAGVELNMQCIIKDFKYYIKQNRDINYTLEVEEYIDPEGAR